MKSYEDFTLEDFVQDLYFRKWVLGELNEKDSFWENWYTENTDKQAIIDQARSMVIGLQYIPEEVSQDETDKAIEHILLKLKDQHHTPIYRLLLWKVASVLVIVFLGGMGLWKLLSTSPASPNLAATLMTEEIKWINNDSHVSKRVQLPDSSKVDLRPLSRLGVMKDFGKTQRSVLLIGEAFFNVEPDPRKPFFVHSGNVVTKVVGTSFWVRSYEKEDNVSVSVVSGKVTVQKKEMTAEAAPSTSEIILTPNQQAVISKSEDKILKKLATAPVIISESEKYSKFRFTNTPISDVFLTLETAYGITISYDTNLFKNCNLTAWLSDEDFFEKLNLICETIQAEYSITDGQILIQGLGCN